VRIYHYIVQEVRHHTSTKIQNNLQKNNARDVRTKPKSLHIYDRSSRNTTRTIPCTRSQESVELSEHSLLVKKETSPACHKKRRKSSSTETMFIQNAIHSPDVRQIIRCLAKAISVKIKEKTNSKKKRLTTFEECTYRGTNKTVGVGSYNSFLEFLSSVFHSRHLPAECGVVAVIYIDRLLYYTKATFDETNWRLIVFTALLLANKVWSEYAIWNEDFAIIFPDCWVSVSCIYRLEREFLRKIAYNLNIIQSVYTKYYFELRTFANQTVEFPIDKNNALKLDYRSQQKEIEYHLRRNRSLSADAFITKHSKGRTSIDQLIEL